MKIENSILTIARKDYRVSEVLEILAKARRDAANLNPVEYAYGLAVKDIEKFAPALAEAGISEDAEVEALEMRSLSQQRRDIARGKKPTNPWRAVGQMDAEAGDINNLLRSHGNDAAAE